MGYRISKYQVCPEENEQLELTVKLQHEPRSTIHGVVKDCNDNPVKDAVVTLYEHSDQCNSSLLKPLTHTFSDECGQFIFGPVMPFKQYIIKVWYDCVKIVPIIIKPTTCIDECCDSCHCSNSSNDFFEEVEI